MNRMRQWCRTPGSAISTLLLLVVLQAGDTHAQDETGLTQVRVQLKWFHQFQFAGYYVALEQGLFRDAGLDVTLIEGGPHINPTEAVLAGEAEFGIGTSGLVVTRSRGRPVLAVAAIFQHSPYILVAREDDAVTSVQDLAGRTVMVEPYAEELLAYLHVVGVNPDSLLMTEHSGNPTDLYPDGPVAMTAYTTTEPYILDQAGLPYRVFDPKTAGIDFYGDTLFTTEAFASANNAVVQAMQEAVVRGWRHALNNVDESIALIEQDYHSAFSPAHLRFEADNIRRLLIPDMIEIGYMNPERWQHIAEVFAATGLLEQQVDIEDFLFSPDQPRDWRWVLYTSAISGLVILICAMLLWRFITLNRALRAEIVARQELELELRRLAVTDVVTGLLNRRGFLDVMARELERQSRSQRPFALMELDIDHFKDINDAYGHAVGDKVLLQVAGICREFTRGVDVVARIGGEEFMIGLPDTGMDEARSIAERILQRLREAPVALRDEGCAVEVAASIGLICRRHDEPVNQMMQRVDEVMYQAKRQGRDRLVVDGNASHDSSDTA